MDEDTGKTIAHGRRIRACLKQPEFAPVSVPAQIAILLALTGKLFDPVPLERMTEAEQAVREAAANLPADVARDSKRRPNYATKIVGRSWTSPARRWRDFNRRPRHTHERHHGEPAPED